jgi:mRNA-degrading endonuclease YafQ of YafQ-DinJ toxin-antitoxin module
MEVTFSPGFLNSLHGFLPALQEEVLEKVEKFSNPKNHQILKVHKLKGRLRGCFSFSVNYHIKIVFEYVGKPKRAYLLAVGDHDVYN